MARDFQAALLDELMGRNRNVNLDEKQPEVLKFFDDEVCKYFLCGFCPTELFTNTRADLGPCDKTHDEKLREEYKADRRYGRRGYEEDFCRFLRELIQEVDRRIKRAYQRMAINNSLSTAEEEEKKNRIDELTKKINRFVQEAEELGTDGSVEDAQQVMTRVEQMMDEREKIKRGELSASGEPILQTVVPGVTTVVSGVPVQPKEMLVCDVCGALRSKDDAQQRVEEHLSGKMHLGYARIREWIKEYEESRRKAREQERGEKEESGAPGTSSRCDSQEKKESSEKSDVTDRDKEKEKRRSRSRSRERRDRERGDRDKDRDREHRDRERNYRRPRESDRERDRDRRDRGFERRRSRSRDRDRRRGTSRDRRDRERDRGDRDRNRGDRDRDREKRGGHDHEKDRDRKRSRSAEKERSDDKTDHDHDGDPSTKMSRTESDCDEHKPDTNGSNVVDAVIDDKS